MDPLLSDPAEHLAEAITPLSSRAIAICVHHGGRCFRVTLDQATVFVRRVHRTIDNGGAELVPLLHERGVDLLHVSAQTPLQLHDIRDRSLDRAHRE